LRDAGRLDDARHAFMRSHVLMQRVRAGLREERLRAALDKNPDFQLIQSFVVRS
jgi:hypothetical protein